MLHTALIIWIHLGRYYDMQHSSEPFCSQERSTNFARKGGNPYFKEDNVFHVIFDLGEQIFWGSNYYVTVL